MQDLIILILILILLSLSNVEFFNLLHPSNGIQCLTKKPYNPEYSSNLYFKDRIKNMKIEYKDCDQYRCRTKVMNGSTATGNISKDLSTKLVLDSSDQIHSLPKTYYDDPATFCSLNPNAYPCPNYWVKSDDPKKVPDISVKEPIQVKTYCNTFNQHELSLCGVNDNQRTLLVHPGLEDQGLCGTAKNQ